MQQYISDIKSYILTLNVHLLNPFNLNGLSYPDQQEQSIPFFGMLCDFFLKFKF